MTVLSDLQTFYYIKDSLGHFYRLNTEKELVAAKNEDEAGIFTFLEVSKRLGDSKKAKFYNAVPVPMDVEPDEKIIEKADQNQESTLEVTSLYRPSKEKNSNISHNEVSDWLNSFDDLSEVNWIEFLEVIVFINAMLPDYKTRLRDDHSKIELLIIDLMHLVELCDYDDQQALEIMDRLREAREKRRVIKNELYRVERFQNAVGSNAVSQKAMEALKNINTYEGGFYKPRVDKDLFKNMELKPRNLHKCYADQDYNASFAEKTAKDLESGNEVFEMNNPSNERVGTVFDHKKMDWKSFVKDQVEFFRNAENYIYDLQYDLDQIDSEIDNILEKLEDANFNVVQGYKKFRELKELRLRRKELCIELEYVEMITDRFNCASMLDAYEEIEAEMEDKESDFSDTVEEIITDDEVREKVVS